MKRIVWILLVVLLIGCAKEPNDRKEVSINTENGLVLITAEIADTDKERAQGLMFRESLPENQGMLFIFDDEADRVFWMKNTLIPLDMIFISKDLEVVDIQHAAPCTADPCTLYNSTKPAKYVLEVNANYTIKNSISIGTKVKI
ncbi:DUF192 domain-containing protein [Candidatus Woesearchaeota archaeon]|nr:DUF192 domain-containing protein [Candidatus Woesearchaeota archaeon]